jgi:flagellar biosynthesis/type III secretory pathway chaperone
MPESVVQHNLETIFHKKILLYRSLLDCLKKERENLIQVDLNALWDISKVKDGLVARIMSVRQQMGSVIKTKKEQGLPSFSDMMEAIPDDKKEVFQSLFHTVRMLKGEVEAYRKENVHFMDESLQFIDELISITTGVTYARNVYNNQCQLKRTNGNMLLRREV